jgi:antitoxin (DNA-binding transcriptional repressor) of toxin-antitoxin stability system
MSWFAKCLGLMDQIAAGKLTRVIVTKRGKPVAEMGPDIPASAR